MRTFAKTYNQFPVLFDGLFGKEWNEVFSPSFTGLHKVPAVNISESEEGYLILLAAPGLKKEAFKLNLDKNVLTVSAKTETKDDESTERYSHKEFNFSSFSRSFTLPNSVNIEQIAANYVDGVLKVALPKKEEAKAPEPRQIEVA